MLKLMSQLHNSTHYPHVEAKILSLNPSLPSLATNLPRHLHPRITPKLASTHISLKINIPTTAAPPPPSPPPKTLNSGDMAAAAATLTSSYFPINSKHSSPDHAFRVALLQLLPSSSSSISYSHSLDHCLTIPVISMCKWRNTRIAAAFVAQEEVAAALDEEAAEEQGDQVVMGGESGEGPSNTKLYFGNLPYNCDSAQLAGIIQEYGSPELVEVLYNRETGKSRGFAFVTMSTVEDCNAVIQNLDGSEYCGRTLRVNFSDKPKPKEPLYPETEHKLFVGNLSWSVTSESLIQMFQQFGNVVGARVLYDGETGRSRGYGFVCYSTKEEMEVALENLNGVELEGRSMRVSLAMGRRN